MFSGTRSGNSKRSLVEKHLDDKVGNSPEESSESKIILTPKELKNLMNKAIVQFAYRLNLIKNVTDKHTYNGQIKPNMSTEIDIINNSTYHSISNLTREPGEILNISSGCINSTTNCFNQSSISPTQNNSYISGAKKMKIERMFDEEETSFTKETQIIDSLKSSKDEVKPNVPTEFDISINNTNQSSSDQSFLTGESDEIHNHSIRCTNHTTGCVDQTTNSSTHGTMSSEISHLFQTFFKDRELTPMNLQYYDTDQHQDVNETNGDDNMLKPSVYKEENPIQKSIIGREDFKQISEEVNKTKTGNPVLSDAVYYMPATDYNDRDNHLIFINISLDSNQNDTNNISVNYFQLYPAKSYNIDKNESKEEEENYDTLETSGKQENETNQDLLPESKGFCKTSDVCHETDSQIGNSDKSDFPNGNSNESDFLNGNSNESDSLNGNSNESDSPNGNSGESDFQYENANESDFPNGNLNESDPLNGNSNESDFQYENANESDFPNGNSNESDFPNGNSNESDPLNGNSNESDFQYENANESDFPNGNSNESDFPNGNSNESDFPNGNSNESDPLNGNSNESDFQYENANESDFPNGNSNESDFQYENSNESDPQNGNSHKSDFQKRNRNKSDTQNDFSIPHIQEATEYFSKLNKDMLALLERSLDYNEVYAVPDIHPYNSTTNSTVLTTPTKHYTLHASSTSTGYNSTNLTPLFPNDSSQPPQSSLIPETPPYLTPCFPHCSDDQPSFIIPTSEPIVTMPSLMKLRYPLVEQRNSTDVARMQLLPPLQYSMFPTSRRLPLYSPNSSKQNMKFKDGINDLTTINTSDLQTYISLATSSPFLTSVMETVIPTYQSTHQATTEMSNTGFRLNKLPCFGDNCNSGDVRDIQTVSIDNKNVFQPTKQTYPPYPPLPRQAKSKVNSSKQYTCHGNKCDNKTITDAQNIIKQNKLPFQRTAYGLPHTNHTFTFDFPRLTSESKPKVNSSRQYSCHGETCENKAVNNTQNTIKQRKIPIQQTTDVFPRKKHMFDLSHLPSQPKSKGNSPEHYTCNGKKCENKTEINTQNIIKPNKIDIQHTKNVLSRRKQFNNSASIHLPLNSQKQQDNAYQEMQMKMMYYCQRHPCYTIKDIFKMWKSVNCSSLLCHQNTFSNAQQNFYTTYLSYQLPSIKSPVGLTIKGPSAAPWHEQGIDIVNNESLSKPNEILLPQKIVIKKLPPPSSKKIIYNKMLSFVPKIECPCPNEKAAENCKRRCLNTWLLLSKQRMTDEVVLKMLNPPRVTPKLKTQSFLTENRLGNQSAINMKKILINTSVGSPLMRDVVRKILPPLSQTSTIPPNKVIKTPPLFGMIPITVQSQVIPPIHHVANQPGINMKTPHLFISMTAPPPLTYEVLRNKLNPLSQTNAITADKKGMQPLKTQSQLLFPKHRVVNKPTIDMRSNASMDLCSGWKDFKCPQHYNPPVQDYKSSVHSYENCRTLSYFPHSRCYICYVCPYILAHNRNIIIENGVPRFMNITKNLPNSIKTPNIEPDIDENTKVSGLFESHETIKVGNVPQQIPEKGFIVFNKTDNTRGNLSVSTDDSTYADRLFLRGKTKNAAFIQKPLEVTMAPSPKRRYKVGDNDPMGWSTLTRNNGYKVLWRLKHMRKFKKCRKNGYRKRRKNKIRCNIWKTPNISEFGKNLTKTIPDVWKVGNKSKHKKVLKEIPEELNYIHALGFSVANPIDISNEDNLTNKAEKKINDLWNVKNFHQVNISNTNNLYL